jgi:hypothetical protein
MKKTRKNRKATRVVDVKKAQAHDVEAPVVAKLPAKNASAVQKGVMYAVLAGRPSKQAVTAVFGKTGYTLSWIARAERLGVSVEELCERFKQDANEVKRLWAELAAKQ